MTDKAPSPEQIEAARQLVADADAKEAARVSAANEKAAAVKAALYDELRELVASPAYIEVREKLEKLAPKFLTEGAHVPYLFASLNQVAGLVPAK